MPFDNPTGRGYEPLGERPVKPVKPWKFFFLDGPGAVITLPAAATILLGSILGYATNPEGTRAAFSGHHVKITKCVE